MNLDGNPRAVRACAWLSGFFHDTALHFGPATRPDRVAVEEACAQGGTFPGAWRRWRRGSMTTIAFLGQIKGDLLFVWYGPDD